MPNIDRRKRTQGGMLTATIERLMDLTPSGMSVLDVGGAGCPFNRANWVIDVQSYSERAGNGSYGPEKEHFTEDSWVRQDICSDKWPFENKQFDFAICAHTLEDVRDPIPTCQELNRVAKAGYIECPSRLVESIRDLVRSNVIGYGNHRWFVEISGDRVLFTPKSHLVYHKPEFSLPYQTTQRISAEDAVVGLFWTDGFGCSLKVLVHDDDVMDDLFVFVDSQKWRLDE